MYNCFIADELNADFFLQNLDNNAVASGRVEPGKCSSVSLLLLVKFYLIYKLCTKKNSSQIPRISLIYFASIRFIDPG